MATAISAARVLRSLAGRVVEEQAGPSAELVRDLLALWGDAGEAAAHTLAHALTGPDALPLVRMRPAVLQMCRSRNLEERQVGLQLMALLVQHSRDDALEQQFPAVCDAAAVAMQSQSAAAQQHACALADAIFRRLPHLAADHRRAVASTHLPKLAAQLAAAAAPGSPCCLHALHAARSALAFAPNSCRAAQGKLRGELLRSLDAADPAVRALSAACLARLPLCDADAAAGWTQQLQALAQLTASEFTALFDPRPQEAAGASALHMPPLGCPAGGCVSRHAAMARMLGLLDAVTAMLTQPASAVPAAVPAPELLAMLRQVLLFAPNTEGTKV